MARELAPPRTGTIMVEGDAITVLLNPPISVIAALQSNNGDRTVEALATIVVAHPYTRDGKAAEVADFDRDLVTAITTAWAEAETRLPPASGPTSLRPTSPVTG